MNTTSLARLAYLCLAVVAVLGLGASSASAWTDPWGWEKDHVKLVAIAGSTLHVVDDETFGDPEVVTANLTDTVFGKVSPPFPTFTKTISLCAGNEVRAELEIDAETHYWKSVYGYARLRLYEGSSCATTDLDGVSDPFYFSIDPNFQNHLKIPVNNTAEGGDYAVATLKLKALLGQGR